MVNSQADMLVPGSKESRLAQPRSSASCTRSSARSTFRQSEIANARSDGTAASIAARTDLVGGAIRDLIIGHSRRFSLVGGRLVQPVKNFGKPIRNALADHLAVHGSKLQPDLGFDVSAELHPRFRGYVDSHV